jgi:hypothetical protein
MEDTNKTWSFVQYWNDTLEKRVERPVTQRERIWASELGGSYIDRYLKMKGVEPTNPPNARSLRKFEAGNLWEAIVGYILTRSGIVQANQKWLKYQYDGLLPVTGKLDFLAGGTPDYNKARETIYKEFEWVPEVIKNGTLSIIDGLQQKYGDTKLKEIVLEIKSSSSFMYDVRERTGNADSHHVLQLYHYMKSTNLEEGHIVYICKDDCRMMEVGLMDNPRIEEVYRNDIEQMTNYIKNDVQPPKQKMMVFKDEFGKFSANWKVGYSNYLTYLYEFENQMEFDDIYRKKANQWNRVLGRVVRGDNMTDANKKIIAEIKEEFPNFDELVKVAKRTKAFEKEE